MSWNSQVEKWLAFEGLDQELKNILVDKLHDLQTLEDSFYKDLEFGTGGIRGELGPGPNRMNIYTVRKAAKGLGEFISQKGANANERGIVIAYDCRYKSKEFAVEVARTVGLQGIKVYLFNDLRPSSELSFAVRYLKASAGVVITASHNPPQYNGFKVYGEDGGQIPPAVAEEITSFINKIEDELVISVMDEKSLLERGLLIYIGPDIDTAYLEKLKTIQLNCEMVKNFGKKLKIVFTPLHGTAQKVLINGLKEYGFENITIVKEQENPDPEFSTVKSPNPEEHEAFEMAIQYGKQVDADILMATDPDADRLGVAAKNKNGDYDILTGNQIGALMLHYLLIEKKEKGKLPNNSAVIKTIVTSEIGKAIADDFGIRTIDTLTGFKYIGEKIKEFESTKQYKFQFGYEESCGYLISDFVRDKDAIQAAVFTAEVAAYYKSKGKTLFDGLHGLYKKYGFYLESLKSITLKGKEGAEQISGILKSFRENPPKNIAGAKITIMEDYHNAKRLDVLSGQEENIHLPKSNVLKFYLQNDSWFSLRPSGTEPMIKLYFSVKSLSEKQSGKFLEGLENEVMNKIEKIRVKLL
ncbi:phospho-sugar mutase [Cytobacillus sp. NCCP-133]|uniref:phospho-sugar mutase n=1 Tax=Cytobacillus sp. NCCP-133 TaxID=766848 RepID=UPI00222F36BC|nr:phospho-sugar mutase [Cytobacillus sp. NCCP-133]GLB61949.1 phosphoglucomutase [Cytobacillus sp. NCCP-133]